MEQTIEAMTPAELALYMGSASNEDGARMKEVLIDAGHGDKCASEICDVEWMTALRRIQDC